MLRMTIGGWLTHFFQFDLLAMFTFKNVWRVKETLDSFSHTLRHRLDLESVYSHFLPNSGLPEVTTLHSGGGATVDYIFYSPRRNFDAHQGGRWMRRRAQRSGFAALTHVCFFQVLVVLWEEAWSWLVLCPSYQKMSCGQWMAFLTS